MRRTASPFASTSLALAVALLVAGPLAAQQFSSLEERMSAADFQRAGLDKLSPEELAALNAWLQRDAATRVPPPSVAPGTDRAGFPVGGLLDGSSGPDRIVSSITGTFRGWEGGDDEFTLDNGQVWRTIESSSRFRQTVQNPRIIIERGLFDAWFLRVDGFNERVRVRRVK
jgi:hypothetical protein